MSKSVYVTLADIDTLAIPLRTVYGSEVHGISHAGTSDRDEIGFCAPTVRQCLSLNDLPSSYQYKTALERDGRYNVANHAKSEAGDLDLIIYDIRHWARLALAGNPQANLPLYVGDEWVVTSTDLGLEARAERGRFLSVHLATKSFGYMVSQYERMVGIRGNNVHRPELVAKHGYDTKFAAHMIRLGVQTLSVLNDGVIATPLPDEEAEYVIGIRNGYVSQDDVVARFQEMHDRAEKKLADGDHHLPERADEAWVEDWVYRNIKAAG